MTIKLTKNDAGEVEHKMNILADEPELQESYGINQSQADDILASIPVSGGLWTVPPFAVEAVKGEMQDHALILRNIAQIYA